MKKIIAMLLAAVFAVSMLAACGNTTPSSDTKAADDKQTEAAAPETQAQTADFQNDESAGSIEQQMAGAVEKAAPGEYFGDSVTIACSMGASTWDPLARGGGFGVAAAIFEKLGQADQEGNLKLQMLKSINKKDDLTYECELWDFITDTAGNNITANDVAWSIQAYIDAGNVGAVPKLDHIEVTGDYTFNWICNAPFGVGEYEKQFGNPPIFSQKAYERDPDNMASNPVGTGPYKLKEFMEGSYGIYEANEDYWFNKIDDEEWLAENDYVWSYQNYKEIRCDVISDAAARAIALENGSVDACTALNASDVSNYVDNPDFTTVDIPVNPPVAFYFNLNEVSACSDINLRKAICYAIDNAGVAAGLDVPAFQVYGIQPRMYDAPEEWLSGREYYDYNVDKAKECLAESNYNGEPIVVMYGDQDQRGPAWILIQAMCNDIGINLELKMVEMSVMNTEHYVWDHWDIISETFGGGNYVPNTVKRWWSQEQMNELNGLNICGIEDPVLDGLYEDMINDYGPDKIEAWDQYFTYDACVGYAVCCINNQTAVSSKFKPATAGQQYQFCPGAFTPAE